MHYTIRHVTRFLYTNPIGESVMEVRMQPLTQYNQLCRDFKITADPRAQIKSYQDYLGNMVHHFSILGQHNQLIITCNALVQVQPAAPLPETVPMTVWDKLDKLKQEGQWWEMLRPSRFARSSTLLKKLEQELEIDRSKDPLTVLRTVCNGIYNRFDYAQQTTQVHSPIDEALETRRGVCQDFTHIMLTMARNLGIPCRYVSGYLYHQADEDDRSAEDATHAWVEAYLPQLGWIGLDPTNDLIAEERHVRVAIGRDYADVPPTQGVFKGQAETDLSVGVRVKQADAPAPEDEDLLPEATWALPDEDGPEMEIPSSWQQHHQQQQQQQQ